MTTQQDINELRKLSEKATPGPWAANSEGYIVNVKHITRDVWLIPRAEEDLPFIVAMRNHLHALLAAWDERERLKCAHSDSVVGVQKHFESKFAEANAEIGRLQKFLERFTVDECWPYNHKFAKLDGEHTRCPVCLVTGLEAARKECDAAIARAERWKECAIVMSDNLHSSNDPSVKMYEELLAQETKQS